MRIRRFWIFVLLGLWGWAESVSQEVPVHGEVFIHGEDPSYSGVRIHYTIPDHPILDNRGVSGSLNCDSLGAFSLKLKVDSESSIKLRTGIYEARLYIEPGKTYELKLPPYREVAYAEQISPFFEPLRIPLRVKGAEKESEGSSEESEGSSEESKGRSEDINNQIFRFDSAFNTLNEQVVMARRRGTEPKADSMIGRLDREFPPTSAWFSAHTRHKKGILKLNEGLTKLDQISQLYLGSEVKEMHPAYMELFGAMFKDFLVYYNRTREGEGLRHHINRSHNLDSLRSIVSSHPAVTNDTICDLILLQELPAMFYRGDFHKEAILILLDSMERDPVKEVFASYAGTLRKKLSSLLPGYVPPDFRLPATDGTNYSPADFKGKYTYLMFCTPDHYGCMMEYPFLNSYMSKHSEYLEVVCIMVAEYAKQVTEFMERNKYHWKALYYGGENVILDNYLVKAFPVAYLLGPDGNIILSPAPLPSDGFEQHLFRIMRSRGEI